MLVVSKFVTGCLFSESRNEIIFLNKLSSDIDLISLLMCVIVSHNILSALKRISRHH